MIRLYFFCLTCLFFNVSFSQNWINSAGSLYNDESYDIEVDASGNVFTTGYTTAQSTFGTNITINTNGYSDIYVSKSNSAGVFLWVKVFGGAQADRGYDLELDVAGNIYITGYFQGTANFDAFTLTSNGSQDAFIAKIDPQGNVLWVVSEGGAEGDTGYGITVDGQGNVIATGQFKGTATIGPNTFTSATNPNTGLNEFDIFISKYDASGNDLWSIQGFAKYDDRGLAVKADGDDNIIVTGQFSDTLTIAGNVHNNSIFNAGMVLKLDPNGNEVWFKRMGAVQTLVYDLETDSQNNVYITGDFQGQLMILNNGAPSFLNGSYQYKIFLIKLSDLGEVLWMTADASDSEVSSKALSMDVNGNLYLAGTFKCVMDEYADSLGAGYFNSVGFNDVFIAKFSNAGSRLWMRQYGGPYDDYCSGIAIDQIDKPLISGGYTDFFNYPSGSGFTQFPNINYPLGITNNPSCPQNQAYGYINAKGNKDIFIGQPVDFSTEHYYYYKNTFCGLTNEPCFFGTCPDTVTYCATGSLVFSSNTYGNGEYTPNIIGATNNGHQGPYFDVLWSTGEITKTIQVVNSGTYTLKSERIDGCEMYEDTIEVIINPIPSLPLLSDSLYINYESVNYNDITICNDTVWTWFSDLDSGLTLIYSTSNGVFNDTLVHGFTQGGNFNVKVVDSNNCSQSETFKVRIEYPTMDTIVPYIIYQDIDSVCEGTVIHYVIADSLTNPNGIYSAFCSSAVLGPVVNCLKMQFTPTSTGWYYMNQTIVLGYDNSCGFDTTHIPVSDSIYITVLPKPWVNYSVSGNPLLCPGGEVQVWTSDTFSGFHWAGSSVDSINTLGDTIWVSADGYHTYSGTVVDTITGCYSNVAEHFYVQYKTGPEIISNVPDNIICPGDSIQLTCVDPGISYVWVGPQGNTIGSTQSIWVDVPGFYHCIMLDADSCLLTSNSIELKEYNSPYVMADPGTELCHTGAIELTAIYSGDPNLLWLPPINSTDPEVIVTLPGVYYMQVTQCGFTVSDSIVITLANINAEITVLSDTIICPGDTVVLMANSGMSIYQWNPAFYGQTFVTTEIGEYVVTITDGSTGCTATSDTVSISYFQGGIAPTVATLSVCLGDSAILVNSNQNVSTNWFINDSIAVPVLAGDTLIIYNITADTTIYVENFDTSCISERIPVTITISPASYPPLLLPDTSLCAGTNFSLFGSISSNGITYTWTGPNGLNSNQNPQGIVVLDSTYAGYYVLTSTDGNCSNSDSILVGVLTAPVFSFAQDSILKCTEDLVLLYASGNYQGILWNNGNTTDTIQAIFPGIYSAFITDSMGCTSNSDTIVVLNFSSPNTSVSDTIICSGESLVYQSVTGAVVSWFSVQDSFLYASIELVSPNLSTDQTYFANTIDSNGCSYVSDVIHITVIPSSGAVPISGDSTICFGTNVYFESTMYPGATYEWTHNGNTVSTSSILYFPANNWADTGVYVLSVTGLYCYDPINQISLSFWNNPLQPAIYGDSTLCQGDTLILYTNATTDSLVWYSNWTTIPGMDSIVIPALSPIQNQVINLIVIDSMGCVSPSAQITVNVYQNPQIPIINDAVYCVGEDVFLFPQNAFGNVLFEWTDEDGNVLANDTLSILGANTSASGTYYLSVIDNHACSNSDSMELQILLYPIVDFGTDSMTVCIEDIQTFELEVDPNYDSYLWQNGSLDYYFNVMDTGLYIVTAGIGNCFHSDSVYIDIDTCTTNFTTANVITPNGDGINDFFTINYPFETVVVFNRWGEIIFETNDEKVFWDGRDRKGEIVSTGVYFYVIEAEITIKGHIQVLR